MPTGTILNWLDRLYPPFRKLMPLQTFRYLACGGANTALDILLYFVSYNFILRKEILFTPLGAISPHIAAFGMAFAVSFPTGFFLNRFVVFPGSVLRGRVQLFRYFLLVLVCILFNYVFLKLFVEICGIFPTVAKTLTTLLIVSFSYFTQKHFTFRTADAEERG
jgi:putative flippase GtrA